MNRQTVTLPFKQVDVIAHLADIHIRLYNRYEEYVEAFETLRKQLVQLPKNSVIVVAGDIVHTKTDMSPELVSLTSDFLRTLANIRPTIIIAGNHDMNMANVSRMDALTPIIKNIDHPQLHYFRESGVYTVANVDFAVCSIIGDRTEWPSATDCTSDTKIALFHGPIYNAKTDVGYVVTSRHVMTEHFDGYDMVLLGDIHRFQVLQEYDEEELEIDESELQDYLKKGWVQI